MKHVLCWSWTLDLASSMFGLVEGHEFLIGMIIDLAKLSNQAHLRFNVVLEG